MKKLLVYLRPTACAGAILARASSCSRRVELLVPLIMADIIDV